MVENHSQFWEGIYLHSVSVHDCLRPVDAEIVRQTELPKEQYINDIF